MLLIHFGLSMTVMLRVMKAILLRGSLDPFTWNFLLDFRIPTLGINRTAFLGKV